MAEPYSSFNVSDLYTSLSLERNISINEMTFLSRTTCDNSEIEFSRDFLAIIGYSSILYVDKGELDYMHDGIMITLTAGDAILTKAGVQYNIIYERGVSYYFIHFAMESNAINFLNGKKVIMPNELKKYFVKIYEEVSSSFTEIEDPENDSKLREQGISRHNYYLKEADVKYDAPIYSQQYICAYLEFIMMGISRRYNEKEINEKLPCNEVDIASTIVRLLENNVFGRISVTDICLKLPYCKTVLSREFKKAYGCTMMRYYNELKLAEAKKMVNEGVYTISEISEMLMFSNVYDFSRVFKRLEGCSPSEYKKRSESNQKIKC